LLFIYLSQIQQLVDHKSHKYFYTRLASNMQKPYIKIPT
jgi:hypothetical protein